MKFLFGTLALFVAAALVLGITVYTAPLFVGDQRTRFHLWRAGVRSEYVQAGAYRLHYFEARPPHGMAETPLVLVHGLGSRGEDWSPLIPGLAANGFHVYAVDLPGFGRSPRPDVDYSIGFQAKAVADFIRAVGLQHADVGGWSMGGWVAARLTLDHPEMVDRLALYDSAGMYFPRTFDARLFLPTDAAGLAHLTAMLTPRPKPFPKFVAQDAIENLQRNGWVTERSVNAMLDGHDLLDFRLHLIQKPTLLVWGKEDRLIPLVTGEEMHRQIADSVLLVVNGCGHLAPGECYRPVLRETIDFLKADAVPMRSEATVAGNWEGGH